MAHVVLVHFQTLNINLLTQPRPTPNSLNITHYSLLISILDFVTTPGKLTSY